MERAQDLKNPLNMIATRSQRVSIIIIILFHVVGLIGCSLPATDVLFLKLVPWHLLLMTVVIMYNHNQLESRFFLFVLLVFIIGFTAELIGVHTGWLFGNYAYGETLGIQLFRIPLMIGVNWFLLIYSTGVLLQRSRIKNSIVRILAGAAIMLLLDVLIEPIAIHFDYWHWTNNHIPIKNYVCWFGLSAVLLFIFDQFKFKPQSIVAPVLLITQFVFFMALELLN
ncbi:putative membrane protein [Mucilaginibacter lappiensis]|uniref:Membrane protein n=1 Tax=Mucilaginibacter lappiensis TaxID=354630 RepID=A0ABR6PEB9_9SPHI|nr:carotenoid biosynthesis protein [Mucilaginibacter lappiensis]MBB6108109.1 putative membrane protein [Mucilaginibacter lappiensis]SIS11531.1 putative membrane protein [Mucilaginibacter lappiensis]